MTLEHALLMLFLGLATGGLAIFARALPWPKSWLARKPLICSACTTGWVAFAVIGGAVAASYLNGWTLLELALLWCSCIGIGAPMHHALYPPEIDLPMP